MPTDFMQWIQLGSSIVVVPLVSVMWDLQKRLSKIEGQLEYILKTLK